VVLGTGRASQPPPQHVEHHRFGVLEQQPCEQVVGQLLIRAFQIRS
jgi:hypothetical protein